MIRRRKSLRQRIHPEATPLYDVIVTRFLPESFIQPTQFPRVDAYFKRREDERKFRAFMGSLACKHGMTSRANHSSFSGWPDHVAIVASESPALRTAAWQLIRDEGEHRIKLTPIERLFYRDQNR